MSAIDVDLSRSLRVKSIGTVLILYMTSYPYLILTYGLTLPLDEIEDYKISPIKFRKNNNSQHSKIQSNTFCDDYSDIQFIRMRFVGLYGVLFLIALLSRATKNENLKELLCIRFRDNRCHTRLHGTHYIWQMTDKFRFCELYRYGQAVQKLAHEANKTLGLLIG